MSKPPRVFVLHGPPDEPTAARLTATLRGERFDLAAARKLPESHPVWFVLVVSPDLRCRPLELNWVMDHHPDRVLPVLARPCDPGQVHPRLDFLPAYDLSAGSEDELARLARECQRPDVGRAKPHSSVVMFLSLKGGVAKTTNLVAVAECLAEQGNRVLVVDTDHQCGASAVLLGEEMVDTLERRERTLNDLLRRALDNDFETDHIAGYTSPATSIAGVTGRLSVIPGSLRLEDFWSHYRQTPRREASSPQQALAFLRDTRSGHFKSWLKAHYDYVLVDCPPAVSWQVRIFLRVAEGYVVPTVPDRLSVRGARYLTRRIQSIGVAIRPVGLLWSMYREQCSVHREYVEGVRTGTERMDWEDPAAAELPRPFATAIPHGNDVIKNSLDPDTQPRTFSGKYGPAFAERYRAVTREMLGRLRGVGAGGVTQLVASNSG
jgi:chromosome partitioning protein